MSCRRVAVLSVHTSPLAQPGTGDGGGMNVYVRALASRARPGRRRVRRPRPARARRRSPTVVDVEPGFRVVHVEAGPAAPVPSTTSSTSSSRSSTPRSGAAERDGAVDVLHANYWLSGAVAHRLKHELDLPLVATFHTLARVKADAGIDDDPALAVAHRARDRRVRRPDARVDRRRADAARARCTAPTSTASRSCRPASTTRSSVPADARPRAGTRRARLGAGPVLLFVGRIQPLKGVDLAVAALAALDDPAAVLLVVGGPSGPDGPAELARLHELVDELGVARPDPVRAAPAATTARRLLPRRRRVHRAVAAESFGLVALEAAACGTPVVAAAVGGLRSLVDDGVTGFLVDGRDPPTTPRRSRGCSPTPRLAAEMGVNARGRVAAVLVEHDRGAAAPALRRPRRARARSACR